MVDVTPAERKEFIDTIPSSAAFVRKPINLPGEYDFGEDVLKDALTVDWEKLLSFEIADKS